MAKIELKNTVFSVNVAESFKALLDCGVNGYLGYWISLISQDYDKYAKAYSDAINPILKKYEILDDQGNAVPVKLPTGKVDENGDAIIEEVPNTRSFSDIEKLNEELENVNKIVNTLAYEELDPAELKSVSKIEPKHINNLLWMFKKPE